MTVPIKFMPEPLINHVTHLYTYGPLCSTVGFSPANISSGLRILKKYMDMKNGTGMSFHIV